MRLLERAQPLPSRSLYPGSPQFSATRPKSHERAVRIPTNSWLADKRIDFFQESREIHSVPLWRFLKIEEEIKGLCSKILYRTLFNTALLNAMNEAVHVLQQPDNQQNPIQLKTPGQQEKSPFWFGSQASISADGSATPISYYLEYRSPSLTRRVSRVRIPLVLTLKPEPRLGLPQAEQNYRNHYLIRLLPPLNTPNQNESGSFVNLYMNSGHPGADNYGAILTGGVSKNLGNIADIGVERPLETLECASMLLNELLYRKRF